MSNEFQKSRPTSSSTELEFRHVYADGTPIAGCRYIAQLSNGDCLEGRLDADGYARLSGLPAGTHAQVRYWDDPNLYRATQTVAADSDLHDVMTEA